MVSEVTVVIGLIDNSLGTAIREPVTTTSLKLASLVVVVAVVDGGGVWALATPNEAATDPPVNAARTAKRNKTLSRLS